MESPPTRPVSPEELMSADEYERARARRRAEMVAHRARRRVRLTEAVTVLFESRASVVHQVQEVVVAENRRGEAAVARTIEEYRGLVPGPGRLTATVFIEAGPAAAAAALSRRIATVPGTLLLTVGGTSSPSLCVEDGCFDEDPVRYVRFEVSATAAAELAGGRAPARLGLPGAGAQIELGAAQRSALAEHLGVAVPSPA